MSITRLRICVSGEIYILGFHMEEKRSVGNPVEIWTNVILQFTPGLLQMVFPV